MDAIQLTAFGTPATLHEQALPDPQVVPGTVRVRIRAAAVNPLEIKLSTGAMQQMMPLTLPWVPGIDFSGVVDLVGSEVPDFQVGDEVYASIQGGGAYAELIVVPATALSHKPEGLSHPEAAAVAGVVQTAWQALFGRGHLQPGQRVLIHGASGGVGTLAVQLARWKGATVIATASRDDADFLHGLGADEVIDSRDPAALSRFPPADLVIDAVGGPGQTALFKLAKPGGQLIALSQPPSSELAEQHGVQASMLMTQPSGDGLRAFEEVFRAGAVRPLVAQSFPLSEVVQAWERQSKHGVRGKLVLIP